MKTPHDEWPWWLTLLLSPLAVAGWVSRERRFITCWGTLLVSQLALIAWVLFGKSPAWEVAPFPVLTPIENYGVNWSGVTAAAALIAVHLGVLTRK